MICPSVRGVKPCLLFPGLSREKSLPLSALHQLLELVTRGQEAVAPGDCGVVDPNKVGLEHGAPAANLRLASLRERRCSDVLSNGQSLFSPRDGSREPASSTYVIIPPPPKKKTKFNVNKQGDR